MVVYASDRTAVTLNWLTDDRRKKKCLGKLPVDRLPIESETEIILENNENLHITSTAENKMKKII